MMTEVPLNDLVREYLREYDTPAPDLNYRLLLRDRLRVAVGLAPRQLLGGT